MTRSALSIGITLALLAGCKSPASEHAAPRAITLTANDETPAEVPPPPPPDTSPVERMTVGTETTDATAMWKEIGPEIRTKLAELPPPAHEPFIAERAALWIRDKIAAILLYQQASLRMGPDMTANLDRYVDGEIRKIITDEHQGIQRRFEKHLESQGKTFDEFRADFKREVIIRAYLDGEIKPKVAEPTRAQLLAIYHENAEVWHRPAKAGMSLIDVRVLDRLPEQVTVPTREQMDAARAEARAVIESAWSALNSGMSFADAARQYSDGLHAAEGGTWGWVTPGSVRQRFEPAVEALYRLRAGETSDIIETPDSFFLVRCDEYEPAFEPSFVSVQQELKERHYNIVYNQLVAELVAKLRQSARIEPEDLNRFHEAVVTAAMKQLNTVGVALP